MIDPYVHLKTARRLARLLDTQWNILGIHFGIDPILDIIPGVTSLIPTFLSLYLIYIALMFDVPSPILGKMLLNIVIDYVIGIIPILGFVADIFFKANIINLKLIEGYIEKRDGTKIRIVMEKVDKSL